MTCYILAVSELVLVKADVTETSPRTFTFQDLPGVSVEGSVTQEVFQLTDVFQDARRTAKIANSSQHNNHTAKIANSSQHNNHTAKIANSSQHNNHTAKIANSSQHNYTEAEETVNSSQHNNTEAAQNANNSQDKEPDEPGSLVYLPSSILSGCIKANSALHFNPTEEVNVTYTQNGRGDDFRSFDLDGHQCRVVLRKSNDLVWLFHYTSPGPPTRYVPVRFVASDGAGSLRFDPVYRLTDFLTQENEAYLTVDVVSSSVPFQATVSIRQMPLVQVHYLTATQGNFSQMCTTPDSAPSKDFVVVILCDIRFCTL